MGEMPEPLLHDPAQRPQRPRGGTWMRAGRAGGAGSVANPPLETRGSSATARHSASIREMASRLATLRSRLSNSKLWLNAENWIAPLAAEWSSASRFAFGHRA